MLTRRCLARVFFVIAVGTMLGSAFHARGAQAQTVENESVCLDGNRKLCAKVPVHDGVLYYYYI